MAGAAHLRHAAVHVARGDAAEDGCRCLYRRGGAAGGTAISWIVYGEKAFTEICETRSAKDRPDPRSDQGCLVICTNILRVDGRLLAGLAGRHALGRFRTCNSTGTAVPARALAYLV